MHPQCTSKLEQLIPFLKCCKFDSRFLFKTPILRHATFPKTHQSMKPLIGMRGGLRTRGYYESWCPRLYTLR